MKQWSRIGGVWIHADAGSDRDQSGFWRRLDYLSAWVAVTAALVVGIGLASAIWMLPDFAAVPVFLLFLVAAVALASRGEPVLVPDEPEQPAVRPPVVPEDWWVDIPGGSFLMGSPDSEPGRCGNEGPVHEVRVSAFRCLRYPVTRGLERRLNKGRPSPAGRDDPPLANISWLDAVRLCNRLSEADGLSPCYRFGKGDEVDWDRSADGYRLLTEAEWEYACRAGTTTAWSFGHDEAKLGEHAWYRDNSDGKRRPVGKKRPNRWDLYDMHGLVWEWCWDLYGPYPEAPERDPVGPDDGVSRVLRGGAFLSRPGDLRSALRLRPWPGNLRSALRDWLRPKGRYQAIGFRCARAPRRQP